VPYLYHSTVSVDPLLDVDADVRVVMPETLPSRVAADSLTAAIVADLAQNVFEVCVDSLSDTAPDLVARVVVRDLRVARSHVLGIGAGTAAGVGAWFSVLSGGALYGGPVLLASALYTLSGAPLARLVGHAEVELRLTSVDGVEFGTFRGTGRRVAWRGLYSRGTTPNHSLRVSEQALQSAMEDLKRRLAIGKRGVIAALRRAVPEYAGRFSYSPVVSPKLVFDYGLMDDDGDKVLEGGEVVKLSVRVKNEGMGEARGVVARLAGAGSLFDYLPRQKSLGSIGPGGEASASFEAALPTSIEAGEFAVGISVTEERGFDAAQAVQLTVAVQPAAKEVRHDDISRLVDVDAPLEPSGFAREDAYAVVVGISNYRQSALPKVTYARKDAEAMKDYLVSVCGFKEGNIKLLVDDDATLSDLTAYCEEWLARNVRKGSFVFVYFAGHGTPSPDKGEAYIVPYDGEPGFVSKLYPLSRLYSSLAALPTDQVVVALDACFSGAGGRSVMEQGKRPLVAVDLEKEAQKLGNVAVIAAAAGNEISQDYDAKRHGLFTYYLLKGLRGEADSDDDGWVTLGELYNYAKPKVLDESQRLGYDQTLQLLPQPGGTRADVRIARAR